MEIDHYNGANKAGLCTTIHSRLLICVHLTLVMISSPWYHQMHNVSHYEDEATAYASGYRRHCWCIQYAGSIHL